MNDVIKRSFIRDGKFHFTIFIVSFFCMFLLSGYILYSNQKDEIALENAKEISGDYHYVITSISKGQVEKLKKYSMVKQIVAMPVEIVTSGNETALYATCEKEDIKHSSYFIQNGTFPKNEIEILAERGFLLKRKIAEENMIGSEIEINGQKRIVSGILDEKRSALDTNSVKYNNYSFVGKKNHENNYSAYVAYISVSTTPFSQEYIKHIEKEILNGVKSYYENYEVLYAEGAIREGEINIEQTNKLLYIIILVVLGFSLITNHNLFDIIMGKWKRSIIIYRCLGLDSQLLRKKIFSLVMCIQIIGNIVGGAFGMLFVALLVRKFYLKSFLLSLLESFVIFFLFTIVTGIIFRKKIKSVIMMSIVDLKGNKTKKSQKEPGKRKSIFRRKFCILKLSLRQFNIFFYRRIFFSLLVALFISFTFFLSLFIDKAIIYSDNNMKYDYRINIEEEVDISDDEREQVCSIYSELEKYIKENEIQTFDSCEYYAGEYGIPIKWFSEEYFSAAQNTAQGKCAIENNEEVFLEDLVILRYSDEMFETLFHENGIPQRKVEKNECVILNRTVNRDQTSSYELTVENGSVIEINSQILRFKQMNEKQDADQCGYVNLNICASVDDFLVYPEKEGNYICLAVSKETYMELFSLHTEYPADLYISQLSDTQQKDIESLIGYNSLCEIHNQKEEYNKAKREMQVQYAMYGIVLFFCTMVITINLLIVDKSEFMIRKQQYAVMKASGISLRRMVALTSLETVMVYFVGIICGVTVSALCEMCLRVKGIVWRLGSNKMIFIMFCMCISISILCCIVVHIRNVININLPADLHA